MLEKPVVLPSDLVPVPFGQVDHVGKPRSLGKRPFLKQFRNDHPQRQDHNDDHDNNKSSQVTVFVIIESESAAGDRRFDPFIPSCIVESQDQGDGYECQHAEDDQLNLAALSVHPEKGRCFRDLLIK